jgi:small-conductance mechanosensitive channel
MSDLAGAPAALGGNGGWFYDLLVKAGASSSLAHSLVEFVFRPLEVLLVVVVAVVVAWLGARAIRRALRRMAGSAAAERLASPRAAARLETMASVTANLWRFTVAVVALATVLGMVGVDLTPLLASATVVGATIGFGAQALVRDYLSGFLLTVEDQYGIGDSISVNDVTGTVEDLSLRVTRIRALDGSVWYLPNGDIRKLANTSRGAARAVVELPVAISSSEDLRRATGVVRDAAAAVTGSAAFAHVVPGAPEVLGLVGTDGTSGVLRVLVATQAGERAALERAVREAAVGALADAGLWSAGPAPA